MREAYHLVTFEEGAEIFLVRVERKTLDFDCTVLRVLGHQMCEVGVLLVKETIFKGIVFFEF